MLTLDHFAAASSLTPLDAVCKVKRMKQRQQLHKDGGTPSDEGESRGSIYVTKTKLRQSGRDDGRKELQTAKGVVVGKYDPAGL